MNPSQQIKWHQKPVFVILFLVFFFPLGLYFMWTNRLWTQATRIVISITIGVLVLANFNDKVETNSNSGSKVSSDKITESETIDGTYTYSDNSAELEIKIRGNRWHGKTMVVSGLGSESDRQNAEYESGIVKGNDLYESSGLVQIGFIKGKNLTSSIGDQRVTLRK